MNKVLITMDGHGRGSVSINGAEVQQVTDVRFKVSVGKANRVLLVVLADQLEVRGPPESAGAVADVTTLRSDATEWRGHG